MATNTALIILPLPVVVNDKQFERFCKVAGAQQLAFDRPYQTNALRGANRTLLITKLMQLLKQQTTDWWLTQLNAVGVPCGPICTLDEVFDNPQIQARGMKIALDHEQLGKVPSVSNPIKLSAHLCNITKPHLCWASIPKWYCRIGWLCLRPNIPLY